VSVEHPDGKVRFIAGIGPSGPDGAIEISVFSVVESDGERVLGPQQMIPAMSIEQATHLHLQISNALGFKHEKLASHQ
jgi:hypothetical protein